MDAITYFLTYPHSSFEHNDFHRFLQSIKPVVWARVATECHQDGTDHIHAIVRFGARVKTSTNMRLFDYMGRHPNVTVPRRVRNVLEYCGKGGNFTDYGQIPGSSSPFEDLVAAAKTGDRDVFDQRAMESRVSYQWAEHLWKRHGEAGNTIREVGQGTECLQLQELQFDGKSTIIVGPSGCGKSTWAKRVAPKPALWVTHLDDLKKLSKEHKAIIFDDMSFAHLPRETQIYLLDQHDIRTIHCRNTNATIPAGMQKIFTANQYPFTPNLPELERRSTTIYIASFVL